MESTDIHLYRFGEFQLDGDSLELRASGEVVPLRPQAASVLQILLQRAGRLVSREEIQEQVWGPDSDVDVEHSLHAAIREVRAALGESGDEARLIQTYPRRGYRFQGEVEVKQQSAGPQTRVSAEPPAAEEESARRPFGWTVPLVAAAAIVAAAVGWASWEGGAIELPGRVVQERISVVPFRVLTAAPADQEFADGLDAEMAGAFDRISDEHTVILAQPVGVSQSERREVARSQAADLLLSGAVRAEDGVVRVTAQLLRVEDGAQIWADSFEGSREDALDLQRTLADRIADAVHAAIHAERP